MNEATIQEKELRALQAQASQQDWSQVGPGIHVKALVVDEQRHTVEYLLKEDSSWKPGLHRHLCETSLLVLDGSITNLSTGRKYETGDFFYQEPGNTHLEQIGDGFTAYISMRGTSDTLVEFLGDAGEVLGAFKVSHFKDLLPAH